MSELFDAFESVRSLVPDARSAGHMTFVHAVIEGRMPGRVFVDDADSPRSAVVASNAGFHFALGTANAAVLDEAVLELRTWPSAEPGHVWGVTADWAVCLRQHFRNPRMRDEFLAPLRPPPLPAVPEGHEVIDDLRVIAGLYRRALGADMGSEDETWLVGAWGGIETFVRESLGAAVVRGGDLLALCAACAVAKEVAPAEAEIEIWTAGKERRRGLALLAGGAFIRQCHERGMAPAWTCESSNEPSRQLARRLGFRALRRIEGYGLGDYAG